MNRKTKDESPRMEPAAGTTYGGYLALDRILESQQPLTDPPHHDEMLFIVQHQVAELWLKLILHELRAAVRHIRNDNLEPCMKILARVKQVQQQMYNQWSVLETLTPSEYAEFRGVFGNASGFQSRQYREVEFLLGNKNPRFIELHGPHTEDGRVLHALLVRPSLYDEFQLHLARAGFSIDPDHLERDWTQPYEASDSVVEALRHIYQNRRKYWDAYDMCEKLVDLEENLQFWRFRHMRTVARIIGHKRGTGGSSGVSFLKRVLDVELFPELIDVRTVLGD